MSASFPSDVKYGQSIKKWRIRIHHRKFSCRTTENPQKPTIIVYQMNHPYVKKKLLDRRGGDFSLCSPEKFFSAFPDIEWTSPLHRRTWYLNQIWRFYFLYGSVKLHWVSVFHSISRCVQSHISPKILVFSQKVHESPFSGQICLLYEVNNWDLAISLINGEFYSLLFTWFHHRA